MKVLAIANAGIRTGFERVAREILSVLHTTGRCDVHCLGIDFEGCPPGLSYPYPVESISRDKSDKMGFTRIQELVDQHRPDVVWALHDLWHLRTYASFLKERVPLATYFPVDTPNIKWHYGVTMGAMGGAAVYTQFAAREAAASVRAAVDFFVDKVQRTERHVTLTLPSANGKMSVRMDRLLRYQNPDEYHVIPHGLDQSGFTARSKAAARIKFGIPTDAFVVLNVNANQYRKRLDITMRAFALLATWAPDAHLVVHCAGHTTNGWDLRQLAQLLNIESRCTFIHERHDELSEDDLVWLYNTADVMVNTAGGEGWGLTSMEGAACGVPQLVPDWSATREIWKGTAGMLPVIDWRIDTQFLNTAHAVVDARSTGAILVDLWLSPERLEMLSKAGLKLVEQQASWDSVADQTYAVLEEAAGESAAVPVSFDELLAAREGEVRSELHEALWWERGEPVTRSSLAPAQERHHGSKDIAAITEGSDGSVRSGAGDSEAEPEGS